MDAANETNWTEVVHQEDLIVVRCLLCQWLFCVENQDVVFSKLIPFQVGVGNYLLKQFKRKQRENEKFEIVTILAKKNDAIGVMVL